MFVSPDRFLRSDRALGAMTRSAAFISAAFIGDALFLPINFANKMPHMVVVVVAIKAGMITAAGFAEPY